MACKDGTHKKHTGSTQGLRTLLPAILLGNWGTKLLLAMRHDCGGLMYPMLALQTTPKMHTAPAAGEPGTAGQRTPELTEQRQHIVAAVVVRSTGF